MVTGWNENLVSLSIVKCLVQKYVNVPTISVNELSKNHDIWVQWVLFGSLWRRVQFGWSSYTFFFTFGSDSGSVLGKTWVLIWLFFDGFWFIPVSSHKTGQWVTYVVD